MQKTLMTLLGLGALAAAHAAPITFTDIVNPADVLLSNQGTSVYTFTHNILDNGFQSSYPILDADLYIRFADDGDQAAERIRLKFDATTVSQSYNITTATHHFNVNSQLLQNDGKLLVTLNVLAGDFYFKDSQLDVTAEVVPEPSTVALLGLGLLGMGYAARRKKKA